jgi:hypothetical protein
MARVTKAELKKAILAVQAERLKHPVRPGPTDAQQERLRRSREEAQRLLVEGLGGAGVDLKKLEVLRERQVRELERIAEKGKADALRRAARQKDTLHASILKQSAALRDLVKRGDFFPYPTYSLETPFLIWSAPLLDEFDSAAVPFGSWAKFRITTSQSHGSPTVSFYFDWPSPYSDWAVINAATFLSATGHVRAHAPWGFGVNTSSVYAYALFGIWFGIPNDTTTGSYASDLLGATGAYGSSFTGGDVETASISTGVSLDQTMFAVPARTTVVFEVAVNVEYDNDDGNIDADFQSGNFNVTCPVVVFSLLNHPPQ